MNRKTREYLFIAVFLLIPFINGLYLNHCIHDGLNSGTYFEISTVAYTMSLLVIAIVIISGCVVTAAVVFNVLFISLIKWQNPIKTYKEGPNTL